MRVNGQQVTLLSPMYALDFLTAHEYDPTRIALERNGDIVPRATFADALLTDDDVLEIVTFVGGG